jgi:peptidyl-prolyl cis-trans isomerase SurA
MHDLKRPCPASRIANGFMLACLLLLAAPALQAVTRTVDRIVAIVNEDIVLESELERLIARVRGEIQQANQQPPPDNVMREQMLERLVIIRLQQQVAEMTGIRVDDETVNLAIGDIARRNNVSVDEFREILARDGYEFDAFREDIRTEITIARLRQRDVDNLVTVTDREVDNFLATRGVEGPGEKEFHVQHILVATSEVASEETLKAARAEAEEALARARAGDEFASVAEEYSDVAVDLGWRKRGDLPTIFAGVVPGMEPGEVSDVIRSPSGFHIVHLLEQRGVGEVIVRQTHARHILIRTSEIIGADEARRRLAQLKTRIENGEDFGELARSNSDDRGSSIKGGDLGWASPGDMVPEFERVMDSLEPGQLSDPFPSQFGWHLMQVLERRDHDGTEEVRRAQAREAIRKRKLEEEREAWLRRLRDEAYVEYRSE